MVKPDIANLDASVREAASLQSAIALNGKSAPKKMSVDEALSAPRVSVDESGRASLRVLFISQDDRLLNPENQSLDGFLKLADMFEEVHILILREGIKSMTPALRVSSNVWIYTATSKHWFLTPAAALDVAREQLVFAAGFRPDLIIARDPFESALVARRLGEQYGRPTQLHILEEYTTDAFLKKNRHNRWRRHIPRFTIKSFKSVRVATDTLMQKLSKEYKISDLAVLPRFQDYRAVLQGRQPVDLKAIYQPFVFVMLYVGSLEHGSTLFRALDAARFALQNPRIGLVVIGDGKARSEFEKRAKLLGIDKQVVFERRAVDVPTYLAAADTLIVTDTTGEADEIIFTAAAAGTPIVMADTPIRHDVFEDGVSGYLCDKENTQAFTDRINFILNNVSLRGVLREGARDAVLRKFHQDPRTYKRQYQVSIEEALFVGTEDENTQNQG